MRKIILFLFVCLLSTNAIRSQTKPPGGSNTTALKQALQLKLDEWHKAGSFPGATLGVVLANGESFGLAVGLADRETRMLMKPTDRMLAGSVGKTFAAATALQMVKEGKIRLDDRIEKYLGGEPWFSRLSVCPRAKDITVRQLMNHTGLAQRVGFLLVRPLSASGEGVGGRGDVRQTPPPQPLPACGEGRKRVGRK